MARIRTMRKILCVRLRAPARIACSTCAGCRRGASRRSGVRVAGALSPEKRVGTQTARSRSDPLKCQRRDAGRRTAISAVLPCARLRAASRPVGARSVGPRSRSVARWSRGLDEERRRAASGRITMRVSICGKTSTPKGSHVILPAGARADFSWIAKKGSLHGFRVHNVTM